MILLYNPMRLRPKSRANTALCRVPDLLTRFRSEAAQTCMDTRRATEGPSGVVDRTSRSPRECNAIDVLGSAAAAKAW